MALKKIKLPDNTVVDVQDSRIPVTQSTDNGKVLGVTNTSGTLGWVTQSGGVSDVQVGGTSVVSSGVANIQTESVSSVDLETPIETTYPSGGFRPNKIYDLGSQTGSKTYALYTTSLDSTIKNEWVWSFTTGSTAPTITWPSPTGMKWDGGSAPTINTNCLYEISIRKIGSYYVGYYKEIDLS